MGPVSSRFHLGGNDRLLAHHADQSIIDAQRASISIYKLFGSLSWRELPQAPRRPKIQPTGPGRRRTRFWERSSIGKSVVSTRPGRMRHRIELLHSMLEKEKHDRFSVSVLTGAVVRKRFEQILVAAELRAAGCALTLIR